MVEAFRGLPGIHKGFVNGLLNDPSRVRDPNKVTSTEGAQVEQDASKAVKAALLISGADKQRYRKPKDKLANNYLLGTDQNPNTFDKALCILGNYQTSNSSMPPYRGNPNNTGVAFLQQGGRRGGGQGHGGCGRGNAAGGGGNTPGEDAPRLRTWQMWQRQCSRRWREYPRGRCWRRYK
jgi:hypothetical protein